MVCRQRLRHALLVQFRLMPLLRHSLLMTTSKMWSFVCSRVVRLVSGPYSRIQNQLVIDGGVLYRCVKLPVEGVTSVPCSCARQSGRKSRKSRTCQQWPRSLGNHVHVHIRWFVLGVTFLVLAARVMTTSSPAVCALELTRRKARRCHRLVHLFPVPRGRRWQSILWTWAQIEAAVTTVT